MTKEELIDAISNMKVIELADLVKELEDKFGVSASAPMAMAGMMPMAAAAAEEEKTSFDVEITEIGKQKIKVIKTAREVVPGLGLKEAKTLVEAAPKVVKDGCTKEEAEEIKKKFEEVGAKITIK
ncbi:MAG: 50S ribosomal protein L7/L12 [Candidatus Eremiobacteraeota bacterium]|nr:50S ribosomal protein L7/L12 [Candidatus Eremiobacteraeota bacterium]